MSTDASIWTALADPKRRQIINLLEEKPRTTSELSAYFDVSRFAVMKHLNVLEEAGLIVVKREGRKRWNSLNEGLVQFLRSKLISAEDDPAYSLVEILDLRPGRGPLVTVENAWPTALRIEYGVTLDAPATQVFAALTQDIDSWWSGRILPDSRIHLETFLNGRLFEASNGTAEGILLGTVTTIRGETELQLYATPEFVESIAQLPLAASTVRFTLQQQADVTLLSLIHRIVAPGASEKLRETVCRFWQRQLEQGLKTFVEQQAPYQHNP